MAGRPKKIITPEICEEAKKLASQGLTKEQIARCLGMSYKTLYVRQNEYPQFLQAIKDGQAMGIQKVTNYLMESAANGNVTASIFYLKNRAPDEWKDRKEVASEDITKKPMQMSDEEIMAELRSHKGEAVGTSTKTTH